VHNLAVPLTVSAVGVQTGCAVDGESGNKAYNPHCHQIVIFIYNMRGAITVSCLFLTFIPLYSGMGRFDCWLSLAKQQTHDDPKDTDNDKENLC